MVFSLEVTVEWIDLELVAELQTNSTGELYTGKSSRYYGITAGMYEIFLDFPCHELSFSGFNDTLVISHYQLYQLNKDYQLLDIEHEDLILTGKFTYLNFSSIEPNMIEILGIWPGSGSVYTTDSWIGVGIEFRKFGSAEAASVDMIAYLEGTPHSITFNQKDDYGAEEYWYFDLHLDEAGIWFIEVEITNTNGPSTFGRVIVLVSSPSVLNEISLSYPSLITGGTVQVTVDVWDSNGIDSVYLWVDDFSKTPRVQMLKVGVSSTGEIYSADLTFNEIGEFWIYFEAINSLGLSTHLGSESILILDEPEILSVDVSPSRYVEPRTDMIVEVNILKSNVPINDVLLTLVDADMESIEYPMSFQSETDRIETYKVEFSLKHKGKYECLVEVSNLDGQTSSYTLTITVEGEDATITPAFEYLFFIGSLMLLIIKRKLHD